MRPEYADCPEFDDSEFENILKWGSINVEFSDTFIDGAGNAIHRPEMAAWVMSWKMGVISFCSLNTKDDEIRARKAAALFIYLWCTGVAAQVAAHCSEAYVQVYEVRRIQ